MKKCIFLLLPLILAVSGCEHAPYIPNIEEVNALKAILDKQDLDNLYSKYIRGTYSQEYDVLDLNYDEDEKSSNYFNYSGAGFFGFSYDLTSEEYDSIVDEKGNIDTFDALYKGEAYYGLIQVARTMSFNRENGLEAKIYNLDILQETLLKTTDKELWIDNSLYLSDDGIFHYESRQNLCASIGKELLFNSISTRAFRDIFSKVDFFDSPGNIEHLDKLYYSICRDLVSKSDKEISDFILENQISIQEKDNIEVSFVFADEYVEEDEADYIFPGTIKGTLTYDKSTYEFLEFSYEIPYQVETHDEETGNSKLINTKFTCQGVSRPGAIYDTWAPVDPVIYDDVTEFLEDVSEQVVPPEIYL